MKKGFLIIGISALGMLSSCGMLDSLKSTTQSTTTPVTPVVPVPSAPETVWPVDQIQEPVVDSGTTTQATTPVVAQASEEDIKLAGCDVTKTVWKVTWCMKNSKLVKPVEGYADTFSKSIQNDSGYRGIYENDAEDTFYTYEYLWKACGLTEDEGIKTSGHNHTTCPCPVGYHIPTTKDWKDTAESFQSNPIPFIDELKLVPVSYRQVDGTYNQSWKYTYISNLSLWWDKEEVYVMKLYPTDSKPSLTFGPDFLISPTDALPLRCVKDNE